jgi:GT2 family glycosyltransferase
MPDLSIVLPTCNRAPLLERALASIWGGLRLDYQVIVVDGASTDHTPHVLEHARQTMGERLKVIREETREGFVKGVNKGFRAAEGRFVTWLNDDARALPGSYETAVGQLETEAPDVGLLAIFHHWHSPKNVAYETIHRGRTYRLCHVRGTLYANFGLARRETFERLGHFDERYFLNAADPDFSLKVWHAGMRVVPAWGAMIDHDETADDRRATDAPRASDDNARLFAKWDLPPRNPLYNDFSAARPCTLRGLKPAPAKSTEAA